MKKSENRTEILLSLPKGLMAKVDLVLWDPVRNKPKYAARSKLVARLLEEWLEQSQKEENNGNA